MINVYIANLQNNKLENRNRKMGIRNIMPTKIVCAQR